MLVIAGRGITRVCLTRGVLVHPDAPGRKDCPHFTEHENEVREDSCTPTECPLYLIAHSTRGRKGVRIQQEEFKAEVLIERLGLAMLLKVWSPELWHLHLLGTCQKGRVSGPKLTRNVLNQNLWGVEPSKLCFNWPSNLFKNGPLLSTADPGERAPPGGSLKEAGNGRWRQGDEAGLSSTQNPHKPRWGRMGPV